MTPPVIVRIGNGATAMSDESYDDTEPEVLDENIRRELRKAKDAKRELADAQAELQAMKREVAFTKAGIPETGPGALLRKAWDGDTDPDAIRKAAEDYGIFSQQAPAQREPDYSDELAGLARAQGATSGTGVGAGMTPGDKFMAAMSGATTQDEMMAVVRQFGDGTLGFVSGNN